MMRINDNSKENHISFEFVIILFFTFYCILPAVSIYINFLYSIIVAALYLIVVVNKKRTIPIKEIATFVVLIIVISLLYTLLTDSNSISVEASNRTLKKFLSKLYQLTMVFLPLLFLDWAKSRASRLERKTIIILTFVLLFFVIAKTISEISIDPNIVRNWLEFGETGKNNIANYFFVYAVPFAMVLFAYITKSMKNIYGKIFMIICIIYQLYFLLLSQYTLSVIIAAIGVLYMLFIRIKNKKLKIVAFVLLPLFVFVSPFLIKFIAGKVPSHSMSVRLNEVYDFLMGSGEMGYNMNGRITLYKKSILAFLHSPLRGNRKLDFDGHATFLTVFANLGLLGGIPFVYLFARARKRVGIILENENSRFTPFWIMLLLMGFTNPIHSSPAIMFMIWFIVPMTMIELKPKEENYANKKMGE